MTILFRYILREYSKIFGMCFSGLVTIYLVIDFFEKVRRFLRYESGIVPILTYFALSLGFSVMLFSSFVPVRRFGELIAVTVLSCMAATIIVAPPLLAVAFRMKSKEQ